MGLAEWFAARKVKGIEQKLKRAHVEQRQCRDHLHDLEARRKKHAISPTEFEAERAKLESRMHDLTERIGALQEEERRAKGPASARAA